MEYDEEEKRYEEGKGMKKGQEIKEKQMIICRMKKVGSDVEDTEEKEKRERKNERKKEE